METKRVPIVQKSLILLNNLTGSLTIEEYKIIDIYLSHLNQRNRESASVRLSKGVLEDILGVDRIPAKELRRRLSDLLTAQITLGKTGSDNQVVQINLFSAAYSERNKETKNWDVILTATEEAKEILFSIEETGYIRYELNDVITMTDRYEYLMYMYLLQNAFRGRWQGTKEQLIDAMQVQKAKTYQEFRFLNGYLIKPAFEQLFKKGLITGTMTVYRKGLNAAGIQFTIVATKERGTIVPNKPVKDTKQAEILKEQISVRETQANADLMKEACNNEFSDAEMAKMEVEIRKIIPENFWYSDLDKYETVRYAYTKMAKQKRITKRYAYFLRTLKNDLTKRVEEYTGNWWSM